MRGKWAQTGRIGTPSPWGEQAGEEPPQKTTAETAGLNACSPACAGLIVVPIVGYLRRSSFDETECLEEVVRLLFPMFHAYGFIQIAH
jgi:hypothetical protein